MTDAIAELEKTISACRFVSKHWHKAADGGRAARELDRTIERARQAIDRGDVDAMTREQLELDRAIDQGLLPHMGPA